MNTTIKFGPEIIEAAQKMIDEAEKDKKREKIIINPEIYTQTGTTDKPSSGNPKPSTV